MKQSFILFNIRVAIFLLINIVWFAHLSYGNTPGSYQSRSENDGLFGVKIFNTVLVNENNMLQRAIEKIQRVVIEKLSDDGEAIRFASIFPGGVESQRLIDPNVFRSSMIQSFSNNEIRIELRDHQELKGAFAAFSHEFAAGATIFINRHWLPFLNQDQVSKLLAEEMGHWIDFLLNKDQDTPGDEGEVFANFIFDNPLSQQQLSRIQTENDKINLSIDGQRIEAELASLLFASNAFFAQASSGTPAETANLESNTLLLLSQLPGSRTLFVSDPPEAPFYSGNNVRGTVYAIDEDNNIVGMWYGEISRLFKVGSAAVACQFYVYPDPNNITTNTPNTTIFLDFFAATPNFSSGQIVKTSSDPVASALNKMLPVNTPPVAFPSAGQAIEAGGLFNSISSISATGNPTLDAIDTDISYLVDLNNMVMLEVTDPLSLLSVSSNATGVTFNFSISNNTATLDGLYGTLVMTDDGEYTYTPYDNGFLVEALRLPTNTISESFNFSLTDGKGGIGSSILTIFTQGKNDTPIAQNDYNFAKESIEPLTVDQYSINDPFGQKAFGNVLNNDIDVDKNDEVLTILGVNASAMATTISQSTILEFATIPNNVSVGRFVWMDGDGIVNNQNNGYLLQSSTGQDITVTALCAACTPQTATLSATPYLNGEVQVLPPGTILGFSNNTAGASYSESVIQGSVFEPSTLLQIDTLLSGQISAGMTVNGAGVPAGTLVNSITYTVSGEIDQLTLSQSIGVIDQVLTFTSSAGALLTGQYGTLVLQVNGEYEYTPFANNPALVSGDEVVDQFLYNMRDDLADTSSATLFITVLGSGNNDPNAVDDDLVSLEAGGLNNATPGIDPSGNLFDNDDQNNGVLEVILIKTPSLSVENALELDNTVSFNSVDYDQKIEGLYGDLFVASDGNYIYVLNNSLPVIEGLKTGESLLDEFQYKVSNGFGTDWASIDVLIDGAYDTPIAFNDTSSVFVGFSSVGNVLANDTDVDFFDILNVSDVEGSPIALGSTSSSNETEISGSYGLLSIGADGSYVYTVDNSNPAVLDLTTLDDPLQDEFNYQISDGGDLSSSALLTITIEALNKAPLNAHVSEVTTQESTPYEFIGASVISVFEPDDNLDNISLTVSNGILSVSENGAAVFIDGSIEEGIILSGGAILFYIEDDSTGNNSPSITIFGTQQEINDALASIIYTPNNGFIGVDTLVIESTDEFGLNDITILLIHVELIPLVANDDTAGPINGLIGGVIPSFNVLTNDTFNGEPLDPTDITLDEVSNGPLTVNSDGTVSVAAGAAAGTYTVTYTICYINNPTNCDQATVTITVEAAPIAANDDTFGPINGTDGGTTASVLNNDELNGTTLDPDDVTLTLISGDAGLTLNGDGTVTVDGDLPAGTYTLTYEICEVLNPTNCDQATVTITVEAAPIAANDDTFGPINGMDGGTTASVLNNDELNGTTLDPNDVTLILISGDAGLTLNGDGTVTVDGDLPAGTYTLTYEICEVLNPTNCDQATVTITVEAAPIAANDDTFGPINGMDGGTTVSVLNNDELNGSTLDPNDVTLTLISGDAGLTLNGDGTVTVDGDLPAGTYTLTYEICEVLNPTNCDQATVTITVEAAPIAANDDTFGPINGMDGGTTVSVLNNDELNGTAVDPDDVTLTLVSGDTGLTLNGDGTVTVDGDLPAGTYTLTYEICEVLNPTNCDQATVTITVEAAPIAANDDTFGPINGMDGGTTVSVLNNDELNGTAVDPDDVTLTLVSGDAGLTLNGDGTVTVDGDLPAGTYTLTYEICEVLNPTNCDQATVTITVEAAPIAANDDTFGPINGMDGGTTASVLNNDELNGTAVDPDDVTLTLVSGDTGLTLNGDGTVTVDGDLPAGTYTLTYEICEVLNPTNCDQATVTITVEAAPIAANDDTFGPINGMDGGTTASVLNNDELNGTTLDPNDVTLTLVSSDPELTMDTDGTIIIAPGTPAGTYTLTYEICEVLNPTNCDQATVTITVEAAPIAANDDTFGPINGMDGGTTASVLNNDELNGTAVDPDDVTLTLVSGDTGLTLNGDGTVTVDGDLPAGTYTLTYEICEVLNPTNCDQATVTITIEAAPISANDDTFGPINGMDGGTTASVLNNDELNGSTLDPNDVTLTLVSSDPELTMDTDGTIIIAPGTPAGTYTLTYEICEVLNPTNCDQATVTITVEAAPIAANDDTFGPINGMDGGSTASVLNNDELNGTTLDPDDVTLTLVSGDTGLTLNGDGTVTVDGDLPAGTYTLTYEICEVLNPTNCDQATVTITVEAAPIAANDDTFGPINGMDGGTTVSVLNNDELNGSTLDPDDVTLTLISGDAGLTLNGDGTVTVDGDLPAGTYTLTYEICEVLNPTNCDQATVTITVEAAAIAANDDTFGPINGTDGGTTASVLNNDELNGTTLDPDDVTLTLVSSDPELTMDTDGTIIIAPGTPAGTYTLTYEICEVLNPTNCDQATVTITVEAAPIAANDDTFGPINGMDGGTTVSVLNNDELNGTAVDPNDVTLTLVSGDTGLTLNGDGTVTVDGDLPAGTYTLTYEICEVLNPTNCDQATVTITIEAAPISANDDTFGPINGMDGGTTASVLNNDELNGTAVDPDDVTLTLVSGDAGLTLNGDGTVTVDGDLPAGTYTLTYEICEVLNPTNCDQATVTITVEAAPIAANDDTFGPINGMDGGTTASVLNNDELNGTTLDPNDVTLTLISGDAGLTLNGDGTVTVDGDLPAGTYTLTYEICEVLNPTNCDQATVTITVEAAPIAANDDTFGPISASLGGTTASVLNNDELNGTEVDPNDVTLTLVSSDPELTMDSNGTIIIAPGTPGGTYTLTYEICEVLNPTNCDQAIVIVDVDPCFEDIFAPEIINCPNDITVFTDAGQCGAIVSWVAPDVTDNCAVESFESTHISGQEFQVGLTEVTYTAIDPSGNTTTCSFSIVVIDNEAPSVSGLPSDTIYSCFEAPVVWEDIIVTDNCAVESIEFSHNSGDVFPIGNTSVTITVTDVNGNMTDTSFVVFVQAQPQFDLSQNSSFYCAGDNVELTVISEDTTLIFEWYRDNVFLSEGETYTLTSINQEDEGMYFVYAIDALECLAVDSLDISVTICDLVIPQIITPDGDGLNDIFIIAGIENYPGNELTIFNRWGNTVYSVKNYENNWAGTTNSRLKVGGDELPSGTYYYVLDTNSEEFGVVTGFVQIKR
jgi:gliding motility-associated-like protein